MRPYCLCAGQSFNVGGGGGGGAVIGGVTNASAVNGNVQYESSSNIQDCIDATVGPAGKTEMLISIIMEENYSGEVNYTSSISTLEQAIENALSSDQILSSDVNFAEVTLTDANKVEIYFRVKVKKTSSLSTYATIIQKVNEPILNQNTTLKGQTPSLTAKEVARTKLAADPSQLKCSSYVPDCGEDGCANWSTLIEDGHTSGATLETIMPYFNNNAVPNSTCCALPGQLNSNVPFCYCKNSSLISYCVQFTDHNVYIKRDYVKLAGVEIKSLNLKTNTRLRLVSAYEYITTKNAKWKLPIGTRVRQPNSGAAGVVVKDKDVNNTSGKKHLIKMTKGSFKKGTTGGYVTLNYQGVIMIVKTAGSGYTSGVCSRPASVAGTPVTCSPGGAACQKYCTINTTRTCSVTSDCHYCSSTSTQSCTSNGNCPTGETCKTDSTCKAETCGGPLVFNTQVGNCDVLPTAKYVIKSDGSVDYVEMLTNGACYHVDGVDASLTVGNATFEPKGASVNISAKTDMSGFKCNSNANILYPLYGIVEEPTEGTGVMKTKIKLESWSCEDQDYYKDRTIQFISGPGSGQESKITAYAHNGNNKYQVTFQEIETAPIAGSTQYKIAPRITFTTANPGDCSIPPIAEYGNDSTESIHEKYSEHISFVPQLSLTKQESVLKKNDLPVLYADKTVFVINKPSGIAVQGGSKLTDEQHVGSLLQKLGLRTVHRLDKDTSGCLILARTRAVARELSEQFEKHKVKKMYAAQVEDSVGASFRFTRVEGTIRDSSSNRMSKGRMLFQTKKDGVGKNAVTEYISIDERHVAFFPLTGRKHQLRAFAASHLSPIVNDAIYGIDRKQDLRLHAFAVQFQSGSKEIVVKTSHPDWLSSSKLRKVYDDVWIKYLNRF
eukprot:g5043.t1